MTALGLICIWELKCKFAVTHKALPPHPAGAVWPWLERPPRPQAGVTVYSGGLGPESSGKLHKMLSIVPAFGKPSTSHRMVVSFPEF